MKLTVYKNQEEQEEEICFRIKERGDRVCLEAVNPLTGGRISTVLAIQPDGTGRLYTGVSVPGLKTDEEGRLIIYNY